MPLHQVTTLSSCEIINVYEPLEEGLDTVVNHHYVSCLTITLSTDSSAINIHDIGYQVRQIRHVNSWNPMWWWWRINDTFSSATAIITWNPTWGFQYSFRNDRCHL